MYHIFTKLSFSRGFMENIIEIKNLFKSYKTVKAVSDLSFTVKKGQLFAFLGLNGAGKSTTISIMCGHLQKDSGTVVINGENLDNNIDKIKSDLGVVFQASVLDKMLTVKENLSSRAGLYGFTKAAFAEKLKELDSLLKINNLLSRTYGKLSGGERRRVDIARAIINDPKILILDEPTTGLDPQTRQMVWNVINKLQKEKAVTVFLTTHYMEEAAGADYVVILDKGKIAAEGTPIELKNKFTGDFILIYGKTKSDIESLGLPVTKIAGGYKIRVSNTKEATDLIIKHPTLFTDYEIIKGNMDDVFLSVTGKQLKEDNQ